jgi:hypothetical protein
MNSVVKIELQVLKFLTREVQDFTLKTAKILKEIKSK